MTPVVRLNGEEQRLPEGATVADAARSAGSSPEDDRGVAVALEGEVVPRADWATRLLADGARVEVLRAVQGG